MRWRQLPPVGEPVRSVLVQREVFPGVHPTRMLWTNSGTAALALALRGAADCCGRSGGEVLLPAYTCPDVLSACLWAGLQPQLVDLAPDAPWMDLAAAERAAGPHTAAIVAINFMGIRERMPALSSIAYRVGAVLVEDSAQYFPEDTAALSADFTIVSFGKGKPVSTLGGGALLVKECGQQLPVLAAPRRTSLVPILQRLVYNAVIAPQIYGGMVRIPGLHIGETHYQPLLEVSAMDGMRRSWLPANVQHWCTREQSAAGQLSAGLLLLRDQGVVDLARLDAGTRLLRYPLLLPAESLTARAEQRLRAAGLGASRLYRRILPEVAGVPMESLSCHGDLAVARMFASRLLTLPVHSGVRASDVCAMLNIIEDVLR